MERDAREGEGRPKRRRECELGDVGSGGSYGMASREAYVESRTRREAGALIVDEFHRYCSELLGVDRGAGASGRMESMGGQAHVARNQLWREIRGKLKLEAERGGPVDVPPRSSVRFTRMSTRCGGGGGARVQKAVVRSSCVRSSAHLASSQPATRRESQMPADAQALAEAQRHRERQGKPWPLAVVQR
jgi:hypothetical protein